MTKISKQTSYIIKDEKGKMNIFQYAPDQDYSGQRASDSYDLMMGLFIASPSHDLWLGEVLCFRNTKAVWGVNRVDNLCCQIVAKKQLDWDMSLPLGQRATNIKKSAKWDSLFNQYKAQAKPQFV